MSNPSSFWVLTVTRGTVSERADNGSSWDGFGGLPDPYVCLTINGDRRCTMSVTDTLVPVWNTFFPAATTTALQAGVRYEYYDADVSKDDVICTGTFSLTERNFAEGYATITCPLGAFQITVRPQ
jgi:Ca2+-dependent lipid-binding protein